MIEKKNNVDCWRHFGLTHSLLQVVKAATKDQRGLILSK